METAGFGGPYPSTSSSKDFERDPEEWEKVIKLLWEFGIPEVKFYSYLIYEAEVSLKVPTRIAHQARGFKDDPFYGIGDHLTADFFKQVLQASHIWPGEGDWILDTSDGSVRRDI